MGLGKTIQVLSLLLIEKREGRDRKPSLLVAPASLLANWAAEIELFAPDLNARIVHSSAMTASELNRYSRTGSAAWIWRSRVMDAAAHAGAAETSWRIVVLDEAQAIKNPGAKQTRAAKSLKAEFRASR